MVREAEDGAKAEAEAEAGPTVEEAVEVEPSEMGSVAEPEKAPSEAGEGGAADPDPAVLGPKAAAAESSLAELSKEVSVAIKGPSTPHKIIISIRNVVLQPILLVFLIRAIFSFIKNSNSQH